MAPKKNLEMGSLKVCSNFCSTTCPDKFLGKAAQKSSEASSKQASQSQSASKNNATAGSKKRKKDMEGTDEQIAISSSDYQAFLKFQKKKDKAPSQKQKNDAKKQKEQEQLGEYSFSIGFHLFVLLSFPEIQRRNKELHDKELDEHEDFYATDQEQPQSKKSKTTHSILSGDELELSKEFDDEDPQPVAPATDDENKSDTGSDVPEFISESSEEEDGFVGDESGGDFGTGFLPDNGVMFIDLYFICFDFVS
jgi:hypothetical protein